MIDSAIKCQHCPHPCWWAVRPLQYPGGMCNLQLLQVHVHYRGNGNVGCTSSALLACSKGRRLLQAEAPARSGQQPASPSKKEGDSVRKMCEEKMGDVYDRRAKYLREGKRAAPSNRNSRSHCSSLRRGRPSRELSTRRRRRRLTLARSRCSCSPAPSRLRGSISLIIWRCFGVSAEGTSHCRRGPGLAKPGDQPRRPQAHRPIRPRRCGRHRGAHWLLCKPCHRP